MVWFGLAWVITIILFAYVYSQPEEKSEQILSGYTRRRGEG